MTINVSEARRHLSRLLDEVERGGEVIITRNGKAVAPSGAEYSANQSRESFTRYSLFAEANYARKR